jgi:hypothetical protein
MILSGVRISGMITGITQTTEAGDPYFNNVSLLLHFNEANGSITTVDSGPLGLTATSSAPTQALISTAQSKFGTASAKFTNPLRQITFTHPTAFAFGTGDFTIESWSNLTEPNVGSYEHLWDNGPGGAANFYGQAIRWTDGGFGNALQVGKNFGASDYVTISSRTKPTNSTGAFHHIAWSRQSGTSRIFFDGVLISTFADSTNYTATMHSVSDASFYFAGFIDEHRVTKGIARYKANFTVPTTAFSDFAGPPLPTYTIGGTISGLTGTVVLQNNGTDNLSISSNGSFVFSTPVTQGDAYSVTVLTPPSNQSCTITNGSGTATANVTAVAVECAALTGYRYLRTTVLTNNDGSYAEMQELRYLVGSTAYPTVNMTSNTTPAPLVSSASSSYSGDTSQWGPYTAFENQPYGVSYGWTSSGAVANEWLQIDLGVGNNITPTGMKITAMTDLGRHPKTFKVEGSNTGTFSGEQTLLYNGSTTWATAGTQTFTF